jgi:hypothetical protein
VTVIESDGATTGAGVTVTVVLASAPFGSLLPGVFAFAVTGTVPLADEGMDAAMVTGG